MYKLLLIDDDEALLESFYKLLDWNKYGFDVVARLRDGEAALEYIGQNHVDAVITDIRMPRMDGIELAGKLCENYPDVGIVFCSAFCDFHYARQAIKYGVVDYISKPISLEEVIEILQKLYQKLSDRGNEQASEAAKSKIIVERERIFSCLLNSKMLDIDNFTEELSDVKIRYRSLYSKCAFATFEIIGMEESLAEKWSNDKNKLYDAVTNAVCVDNDRYYAVRLNFSENMLSVLYISKDDSVISDKRASVLTEDLWTMYELVVVNETFLNFNSFKDFKDELREPRSKVMEYLSSKIAVRSDEQMVYEVQKFVSKHYAEALDIKTIAVRCHFNERYFSRQFKKAIGKGFPDYLSEVRVDKAKQMLRSGGNVDTVWKLVGFGSRRTFERQFQYYAGETPEQYRKNQMEKK